MAQPSTYEDGNIFLSARVAQPSNLQGWHNHQPTRMATSSYLQGWHNRPIDVNCTIFVSGRVVQPSCCDVGRPDGDIELIFFKLFDSALLFAFFQSECHACVMVTNSLVAVVSSLTSSSGASPRHIAVNVAHQHQGKVTILFRENSPA